jgi:RHS repeat-associated protein
MFTYDATGQQTTSAMNNVQMFYDGDRLRGKKSENGIVTYYLRSSVLGGQVVAELNSGGGWMRGYVYLGGEILAVQQNVAVSWMHQDPVAKSKRVTDGSGTVVSTIELDPWGGETNRSSSEAFQPRHFTTYERDSIGSHDAMNRRYNRWWARFEQPDPYGGSYDLTNPQSFNRYSYVQNDPVNFVDPTGLDPDDPNDPPPTTHTDPATGLPTSVPGVNAGVVTIEIGGGLGIGTGSGLGIIDQFEVDTGTRAVIGGEGSQEPSDALPFDNCSQFVKWLSEVATTALLNGHVAKYPQRLTARIFGSDLAELAYSGYERHIHNGAEGFKPELTEAGGDPTKNGEGKQGPGVYGHILFAGGVTLIQKAGDPGGWVLYHGNRLKDWGQAVRGSPQYQSERAGNIAGRAVGGQIWDYLKGGLSQADLINRLTGTLCQ